MKKVPALLFISLFFLASALPVFALEIGETAPDFRLASLDGQKVSLSEFKGRPVVLKLATTWCPTCKEQSQEITKIASFLRERNVAVIEVFVQDTEKMVRDYFQGMSLGKDHVVLLDNGKVAKSYHVYVIPRVLLLDSELKVRRDGSLISGSELKQQIEQLTGK